jgi:hypothetical protein
MIRRPDGRRSVCECKCVGPLERRRRRRSQAVVRRRRRRRKRGECMLRIWTPKHCCTRLSKPHHGRTSALAESLHGSICRGGGREQLLACEKELISALSWPLSRSSSSSFSPGNVLGFNRTLPLNPPSPSSTPAFLALQHHRV